MDSRSRKSLQCNAVVCAWREAFVAEGGVEAVRAVGAWLGKVWGRVKRGAAVLVREFSPVLPCTMADAVPSLPAVESVTVPTYVYPTTSISTECQRWVSPLDVAVVRSAVQRVEAERVAAGDTLYRKVGTRYVAIVHPEDYRTAYPEATVYRRTTTGKATRYHAAL